MWLVAHARAFDWSNYGNRCVETAYVIAHARQWLTRTGGCVSISACASLVVNQTVSENPQFDLGMGEWLDSENLAKKANEAPPP